MKDLFSRDGDDVLIRIKAVPGASRDEIAGPVGDRLKIRVSAPPEAGKANRALCAVVATALGVRPNAVAVTEGHSSALKTVRVIGCSGDVLARLKKSIES